ncbi:MAG: BMP family ABC transporter substrate-binding protein [Deltaproteobacteria bacterium]|nr:BMP family ABC transporter substrate-binding protein [Deltaproteobacteria bacterium]
MIASARRAAPLFGLLLFFAADGCSLIVETDPRGGGIGSACTANDQCHAGSCDRGLCVASCSEAADCPAPSDCFAGKCQLPLKVGAAWVGVVAGGEGWTLTHQEGLQAAAQQLPYMSFSYKENVIPFSGDIKKAVDEFVKGGAQVIIANSFSQRDEILTLAETYPKITFLTCASYKSNHKNAISFTAHSEQPWYIAGKVAAAKTTKKRLGYVGSFITPEVVRHINAFYLGARSVDPTIEVEVNWLGFWYDYKTSRTYDFSHPRLTGGVTQKFYREELLALRLIEDGADVIAHGADSQRSVRLVERLHEEGKLPHPVWTLSNDNRNGYRELTSENLPNGPPMQTCLGSPYWDWGPLYTRLLDSIHRGTFNPSVNFLEPMLATSDSIVGFQLNPTVGVDDSSVRSYVNDVASKGWQSVFDGPYETTGQRDKDNDGKPDASQAVEKGELMSDAEYPRVCWFAKGIVERKDPLTPIAGAADVIPARVPDQARTTDDRWVADIEGPPGAPPKVGLNCNENL